jgi:hypothetical protein
MHLHCDFLKYIQYAMFIYLLMGHCLPVYHQLSFSDQKMSVRPYVVDFSHFPLLLPNHTMPSYQTYHKLITDVWSSASVINYIAIQKS